MLLAYFKEKVNSQKLLPGFMDIPPGHCVFKDGVVGPASGSPPGSVNAGMHYHAQMVFLVSGEPLSFVRKPHQFVEEDGSTAVVFREDSNKVQHEDFKQAMQTDLNTLLHRFR